MAALHKAQACHLPVASPSPGSLLDEEARCRGPSDEQSVGVRLRLQRRHGLDDLGERLRVPQRGRDGVVEGVVVPVHLRQREHFSTHRLRGAAAGPAPQHQGSRNADAFLEVTAAVGDVWGVALGPEQRLVPAEVEQGATLDR